MTKHEAIEQRIKQIEKHHCNKGIKVICLGLGLSFKLPITKKFEGWTSLEHSIHEGSVLPLTWKGNLDDIYYFAPLNSEIAIINGHYTHKVTSRKIQL